MDRTNDHDDPLDDAASAAPVSFLETLAAPWSILSPSLAARNMTGGSRGAFWVSFGLGTLLLAAVIVGLDMWDATVTRLLAVAGDRAIRERSIAEVWRDWHAGGRIGPAELITAGVSLGLPFLAAVAAWLYLPNVHRGGSVWRSYMRSYGAVASGGGLLIIVVLSAGILLVFSSNAGDRATGLFVLAGVPAPLFGLATLLSGAGLLLYWLGRATLAVVGPVVAVELPPRCEGCGYDLTHRPSDDRCTECGMSITTSLTPGLRRPGCDWQARQGIGTWLLALVGVVISPTKFYRRLMLRRPDRESRRFAVWHYPVIACLAAMWFLCVVIQVAGAAPEWFVFVIVPAFVGLLAALAGWCVHRLVGAMMTSWAIVQGTLPDVTWAARVMAYETAFLWVFCVYNGLLLTSFMIYGDWISDHVISAIMVGNQFGFPAEHFAILFGNAAIIAAWMWRYAVAFRHVRWSNY